MYYSFSFGYKRNNADNGIYLFYLYYFNFKRKAKNNLWSCYTYWYKYYGYACFISIFDV